MVNTGKYMATKRSEKTPPNPAKKLKGCYIHKKNTLRNEYLSEVFKNNFKKQYKSDSSNSVEGSEAEIIKKPFTCCVLPNFLEDTLDDLIDELTDLTLIEKNNDLYKFHQSEDLTNISSPAVSSLKNLLYGEFRKWLQELTGVELCDTIDMNFSKYDFTDILLCHDDELEGRRFAYIFYLVSSSWSEQDGGTLDLFGTDENGQPKGIVKSLVPKRNNFVFFEVTPTSFHQVSEIVTEDRMRISVSGWFHGTPFERPLPFVEPQPMLHQPTYVEESVFRSWINPSYLEDEVQIQIREKFQNDSEIELKGFLQNLKYEELAGVLNQDEISWMMKGPANKRHYEETDCSKLPQVVQEFLNVLGSEAMFLVLSNLTGLRLHSLAEVESSGSEDEENEAEKGPCEAKYKQAVRRWGPGSYTLIHDEDKATGEIALDSVLYFNCQDWKPEYGGYTSYIAKEEDEELLTVYPSSNSLALVYRDQDTLRFVKHINTRVNERRKNDRLFQDIFCVYYE